MNSPIPITPGSVRQAQQDSQQAGPQKGRTNTEPAKGNQADHAIYHARTPAWVKQATRNQQAAARKDDQATGMTQPEAAANTGVMEHDDASKPFRDASTAPHIALLGSPDDRKRFAELLVKLGGVTVKCARTALTQTEWEAAYRDIAALMALNNQCHKELNGPAASELGQHVRNTAEIVEAAFAAIQRNRAVFSRVQTMPARESKL